MRCMCTFIYSTCQKQVRKKHRGWHLAASKAGLKEKLIGGLALRSKVVKVQYIQDIFSFCMYFVVLAWKSSSFYVLLYFLRICTVV